MSIARYFAKTVKTSTVYPSTSTTVFTVSGGYTVGQLDVFLNGVRLVSGDDYTATNGTSFTLTNAALSGDVVQYSVYPTSPLTYLSANGGTMAGDMTLSYNAPLIRFNNTGFSQNWVLGSSGSSSFFLQDQTGSTIPFLIQAGAPADSLRVNSTGTVSLGSGQLKFPSAINLSADPNTLDEYEEGTWTPAWGATTTNPTATYSSQWGTYVRVGQTVFIHCRLTTATLTSAGSGNLRITGLPFVAAGTLVGGYGQLITGYRAGWTTTGPNCAYVEALASLINLANVTTTTTFLTSANLAATTDIMISGFYRTSA